MVIDHNGQRVYLLGDPHLGKTFIHGVPLHRRGEREKLVWKDFEEALQVECDLHVCLGDLFDKWMVSYDIILKTAFAYIKAADEKPQTQFYVLKGNHDWIRDLERKSAFDLFEAIVSYTDNIHVITQPTQEGGLLFYPWHPSLVAKEEVVRFSGVEICFGHFDTEFSEHNMVPTGCGIPVIYTGHVHKPEKFIRDNTEVIVVGSMQPYAHGEEANDDLYITVTLDQLDDVDTKNKCVRVLLDEDEILDREIECLQLTIKRTGKGNDDDAPTVTIGEFDMDALFRQAFNEVGVLPEITEKVLAQYHARRVADGT